MAHVANGLQPEPARTLSLPQHNTCAQMPLLPTLGVAAKGDASTAATAAEGAVAGEEAVAAGESAAVGEAVAAQDGAPAGAAPAGAAPIALAEVGGPRE